MGKASLPQVSVIIPVRNEGRYIAACLRSLLRDRYPSDRWEILVVDGLSQDHTREQLARVVAKSSVPITLIDNPCRSIPVALNLGLVRARGSVIIRVDAHAKYPENYISRCVQVLEESGAENVGGPITTHPGAKTTIAGAIAAVVTHPFGVGNSFFRTNKTAREVDTVPFGCFRAEVFRQIGLFDERLARNEDYVLNQRIRRAGGRILLDPRLESIYYSRATLRGLLEQAWVNGFWNAMSHYLYPYSFCLRHALPMLFSLGALITLGLTGLALIGQLPGWLLPVGMLAWTGSALYLALVLWATTDLARNHGRRIWPVAPLIFPSFHFVYGMGITWGWIRALLHWHPWRAGDGVPSWEARRELPTSRMAA